MVRAWIGPVSYTHLDVYKRQILVLPYIHWLFSMNRFDLFILTGIMTVNLFWILVRSERFWGKTFLSQVWRSPDLSGNFSSQIRLRQTRERIYR